MTKTATKSVLIAFVASWFTAASPAFGAIHPNHVSLTEIEFNQKSGSFEVSLCVWPEDLATIVSQLNKKPIALTDESVAQHFPRYLKEKFLVCPDFGSGNRAS